MIGRIYDYFGFVGTLSIVLWIAAIVLLIVFAKAGRLRTWAWGLAVGVAIVALVLAKINSSAVSEIAVDRTEELEAAQQRQREVRARENRRFMRDAANINFQGGGDKPATAPAAANGEGEAAAPKDYGYKSAGRKSRDAGTKREDAVSIASEVGAAAQESQSEEPAVRKLPEAAVLEANQFDRINLFAARATVVIAILALLFDYFRRFNTTTKAYFPVPVASGLLDSIFPKTFSVWLRATSPDAVREYLHRIARKGESFIYFGTSDPLGEQIPYRLRFGPLRLWRLSKTARNIDEKSLADETIFESAWVGRGCVVFVGPRSGLAIKDLHTYLRKRFVPGAPARRTVSVVWALPSALPRDAVEKLVALGREAHFKLVVVSPNAAPADVADLFEEKTALGNVKPTPSTQSPAPPPPTPLATA